MKTFYALENSFFLHIFLSQHVFMPLFFSTTLMCICVFVCVCESYNFNIFWNSCAERQSLDSFVCQTKYYLQTHLIWLKKNSSKYSLLEKLVTDATAKSKNTFFQGEKLRIHKVWGYFSWRADAIWQFRPRNSCLIYVVLQSYSYSRKFTYHLPDRRHRIH